MEHLTNLSMSIEPLSPMASVSAINDLFLEERFERLLSLPVVENGRPIGVISRSKMQRIMTSRFGREINGNKPIQSFMNPVPLVISVEQSVETACNYVTSNISYPITEDFI